MSFIYETKQTKNNAPGNRAKHLVLRKAQEITMKLESVKFTIPNEQNLLGSTLNFSRFFQQRQKLGKLISTKGKAALGFMKFDNENWLIKTFDIIAWEYIGNKEIYVSGIDINNEVLSSSDCYSRFGIVTNGKHQVIYTEFYFENNVPTMKKYINYASHELDRDSDKFYLNEFTQSYPGMTSLPVKIFLNNDSMTSDAIECGVDGLLSQLDELSNEYLRIWNMTKTKPYFNKNLTDANASTTTENISSGATEYIEDDSMNSKLGAGIQILPGNASSQLYLSHLGYLQQEIEKGFGLLRDAMLTANQKNIIEIIAKDEYSFETTITKRTQRQNEYDEFFKRLCLYLKVKVIQPKLQMSTIDGWKVKMLNAVIQQTMGGFQNPSQPSQPDNNNDKGDTND